MKRKMQLLLLLLGLFNMPLKAQWVVNDPINTATSIANTAKEMIQTSKTVSNTLKNYKEVEKMYKQGKKYYDALKSVNNLVKDARKVQQTILMTGEITSIYVNSYKQMLQDDNFSYDELVAIAYGYTKLLEESTELLKELKQVVNITSLQMTDKDRIDLITEIYDRVASYRNLVTYYTNKNISISYLRARKKNDTQRFVALYGNAEDRYW